MRTQETETFEDDAFTAALARGLNRRATADLDGSAPSPNIRRAVRNDRMRRIVTSVLAGAVAVTGLMSVAADPAGSMRAVEGAAAAVGLSLHDDPDAPKGKVGSDRDWSREVAIVVQGKGLDTARLLWGEGGEVQDPGGIKDAQAAVYRVLWAEDLAGVQWQDGFAGARVAVVVNTTTGTYALAQGPIGAPAAQMGDVGAGAGDPQTQELPSWVLAGEDSRTLLVVDPRAHEVAYSQTELGPDGRLVSDWTNLTAVGNGVWLVKHVASGGALRIRAREDGGWFETLNDAMSDFTGAADYGGAGEIPTSAPIDAEAAKDLSGRAKDLFGADWSDDTMTQVHRIGDGYVVVHGDRGRGSGAWALTAELYQRAALDPQSCCDQYGHPIWQSGGSSPVIAAPSTDSASLMAALRFRDEPVGSLMGAVVVLAPEGAARVRVGTDTYPVRDRLAVITDGSSVRPDETLVAEDVQGGELGRTRLGVPSELDSLTVPVAD